MAALNLLRLLVTWRAYGTDGFEQIGFPFVFFECGGFSHQENWYYHWLAADICIAIVGAAYAAHLLRDGWINAFRRFQTWGLEDAEADRSRSMTMTVTESDEGEPE